MGTVYVITGFKEGKKIILKVTDNRSIATNLVEKYRNYNLIDVKAEVCSFVGDLIEIR